MAAPGKRSTPSNVLKITGGRYAEEETKRRENEGAVEPKVEIPPAPRGLCSSGKARWKIVATHLAGMRVMTAADTDALHLYIENWLRWRKANNKVKREGEIIKSPKGYPIQNPWLAIANKAQEQCTKLLIEFGLTPSARARVNRGD